ncbi:hypothetical protein [Acinetobacter parvus]|uniref:hypothetical protein n=1 Tax=Acinetobacter parvus TaxID=134533 RepID=UPI0021CECAE7|nr:hypothetical protein [Acinetobacter parvus]MCU4393395.1 hypothetical protein [Acinetobacter parvus]
MAGIKLFPISGMNNVSTDDALQRGGDASRLFVRDALNVDISDTGRIALRKGASQVSELNFKNIWQSSLHKDVFATLGHDVVLVSPLDWSYIILGENIVAQYASYQVINNLVYICTDIDLFVFDGVALTSLNVPVPYFSNAPILSDGGQLPHGNYVIAMSCLKNGKESGLSESRLIKIDNDLKQSNPDFAINSLKKIQINILELKLLDIDAVRVYITTTNGSVLRHYDDFSINDMGSTIDILSVDKLGIEAQFENYSPMPIGKYFDYWNGRLITADKNVIYFSEPMAYHLHDEKYGFVMLPQRITFLVPVEGGIWVGQVDHVVFLSGRQPNEMTFIRKTAHPPVPFSAISVDGDLVGSDISQGGAKSALWLAENGYVIGTATGQIIELHAGTLHGITAKSGRSVSLARRIITALR